MPSIRYYPLQYNDLRINLAPFIHFWNKTETRFRFCPASQTWLCSSALCSLNVDTDLLQNNQTKQTQSYWRLTAMDDLVLLDTKNQTWKDDKSRFGFKMLQKMGWREDKGLGKNDSGSVASIKVSKREEGLGLGMEKVKSLSEIYSK